MFDPHTLLLLAALAAPLDSAARMPSANDSVLASVLSPLIKPGDHLRVHTSFGVAQGAAGLVGPQGLQLRSEAADIWSQPRVATVGWSQIASIERRTRPPATGARIGAAFGCLLGLAMVMSAASYTGPFGGSGPSPGSVLFAGVVGGVAGALAGGIVGGAVDAGVPAWRTIYERR